MKMDKVTLGGSAVAHGIATPFRTNSKALPPFHVTSTKKDAPEWPAPNSFFVKFGLAVWAVVLAFGLLFYFGVISMWQKHSPAFYALFS